ncbi:MAG: hypothetical protein ACR2LC_10185 [Pyrinomonadaceae bacterium]
MSILPKHRNIIPRWRDFRTTLSLGELDSVGTYDDEPDTSDQNLDFLADKVQDWRNHKTPSFAADLVSSALVLRREDDAREAATFLLDSDTSASKIAKELASKILTPSRQIDQEQDVYPPLSDVQIVDPKEVNRRAGANIRKLRVRLMREPRNAIAWVDLAREYTLLGFPVKKITRPMEIALALAPDNRFILRSAARLYVHLDEPDRARYILRRTELTRYDPWLLAAEIGVSSHAGKPSSYIKRGAGLVSDTDFAPSQTTELASALATVEVFFGSRSKARKLFRKSLSDPNENSAAQAEWGSHQLNNFDVDFIDVNIPRIFEARALDYYHNGQWNDAFKQSVNWYYDQPFSSLPSALSSYLACTILEDYRTAAALAKLGLVANPNDPILWNNLAFSYANIGDISKAIEALDSIDRSDISNDTQTILLATEGLIRYRQGNVNEGRRLYLQAIENANGQENRELRAEASIFLAREEILSNSLSVTAALESANKESKDVKRKDILLLLDRLNKMPLPSS